MRLLVAVFVFSLAGFNQAQAPVSPKSSAPDQLVQLERKWLHLASVGGPEAVKNLISDDWIATTPGGTVVTREDFSGSNSPLPKLSLQNPQVRISGDTAVLMGRLTPEDQSQGEFLTTVVFQRRDGRWLIIATQLSPAK